ncbi:MAG: penicillin-binding protein activator, partial [Gammaproteobacteria bacterium]
SLYEKALSAGVDMIIGPLDKLRVAELSQLGPLPIPTLTLNYLSDPSSAPPNLFQFGLAAEDEAKQIAEHAALDGFSTGAIVFPDTDWGYRVRHAFESTWLSLGGTVAQAMPFVGNRDFGNTIKTLLQIDASEARARELRREIGQRIDFTPRRRQDIEFIVIFGNPSQARQLKPALNFYFAGNLPTFATSNIFTGQINPKLDKDLDGIEFTDIPWLFKNDRLDTEMLLEGIEHINSQPLPRLLALGADAYALTLRLRLLQEAPSAVHDGYTGRLSLNANHQIVRESVWAQFQQGKPILKTEPQVLEPHTSMNILFKSSSHPFTFTQQHKIEKLSKTEQRNVVQHTPLSFTKKPYFP